MGELNMNNTAYEMKCIYHLHIEVANGEIKYEYTAYEMKCISLNLFG